jgi:predicted porin
VRLTSALLAAVAGSVGAPALAQSTVTVYGLLDVAMTSVDNVAGARTRTLDNGAWQSSRIGFRGTEDLGGGLRALFTIESSIGVDVGSSGNPFWGRQSFVGLGGSWGTVTLGRQYDFVYYLADGRVVAGGLESAVAGGPGGSAGSVTPLDLHAGGVRYDNSMKWTRKFGPVGVGLMLGLGQEKAIVGSTDKMTSTTVTYSANGLDVGLAWVKDNYNAASSGNNANEVATAKATYQLGDWLLLGNVTTGKSRNTRARHKPVEVGFMYSIKPLWAAGVTLSRASVTNAAGAQTHINRVLVGTTYDLSKRTLLYAVGGYAKSANAAVYRGHVGAPGGAAAPSSDDTQSTVRIGIRHSF